jgi:DNA polymerase-3 subunit beta
MKVIVPTHALVEAAGHAASAAAVKSPKPVLECVALRADPVTGFRLEATDLDVAVRLRVDAARVEEAGDLLVPAARFLSVVREVSEDEIVLAEEDGSLLVQSGDGRFRIRGESAEAMVDVPFFGESGGAVVPGDLLRDMIRRTVFATAKEAGRYALHGVLFRLKGRQLELVATDGRRLARAIRDLGAEAGKDLKVIVGPKGLGLLDRVLGDGGHDVGVALRERQVLFQVGGSLVVSRLIDGTFPAYEDIIPPHAPSAFEARAGDFSAGLRRATLLTTRDSPSVQFDVSPQRLLLRSRAPEVGEAKVEVPIVYDGAPLQLGFNPNFLTDVLRVVPEDATVRFEFRDGKSPGRLTDREDYVYVVMPIALE